MRLTIAANGSGMAWVGDQAGVAVTNLAMADGRLLGSIAATIPTEDAQRWTHNLTFALLLDRGWLRGQVTANATADRIYYALGSYAELTKR